MQQQSLEVKDDDCCGEEHADSSAEVGGDQEGEAVGVPVLEEEELAEG